MLVVSILEADIFGEELYPIMRNTLTAIMNQEHVGLVIAAGDSKGMIYRLLSEMATERPDIFFTILLSNDRLAYENSDKREALIQRSDIVICRKRHCDGIREINRYCEIVVV